MGKHSRPGPPNQLSRAVPRVDADDRLAAYNKRRRPPLDVHRRHRPLHGGGGDLRPDEPRALEEWNRFSYEPAGTAANLAEAERWVNQQDPRDQAEDQQAAAGMPARCPQPSLNPASLRPRGAGKPGPVRATAG
ncbi:DUF6087 family protein [Streptomyces sp. NPDC002676]